MPQFTIGSDVQATLTGPYGLITIPELTTIMVNPNQSILAVQDLNNNTNTRTIIKGATGSLKWVRADSTLDKLAAKMWQDWQAGVPIGLCSVTILVHELDGTETNTLITEMSIAIKELLNATALKEVMQSVDFTANGYYVV